MGRAHAQPADVPCHWFYAGTFYWFNHMTYFGHPRPVPLRPNRWGAEYHLGSMFPRSKVHCFLDYPRRFHGTLYGLTEAEWDELAGREALERLGG